MKIPYLTRFARQIDLADLQPEDINWHDIAERLATLARFNKGHAGPPFSVAQHCVMGADALWRETETAALAAQFLLHDAHEAFIGDITTPVAEALNRAHRNLGCIAGATHTAIAGIKTDLDMRVYACAGITHPLLSPPAHEAIADMDERMLRVEAEFLFGMDAIRDWPTSDLPRPRLAGPLKQWPWPKAADEWLKRFGRYVGRPAEEAA